jgi:hypothetical protein
VRVRCCIHTCVCVCVCVVMRQLISALIPSDAYARMGGSGGGRFVVNKYLNWLLLWSRWCSSCLNWPVMWECIVVESYMENASDTQAMALLYIICEYEFVRSDTRCDAICMLYIFQL